MFGNLEEAVEAVHAGDAILLDVRTRQEYSQQAAHKAIHLDVADIQAGESPACDTDSIVLIHCRSGGRAGTACTILESRGFSKVMNVGGLHHWLNAGGKEAA